MSEAPRLFPGFACNNPDAMIAWLTSIGFTELAVHRHEGIVMHAELALGASILMLGQAREGNPATPVLAGLYVAVDNADATFALVEATGVTLEEPLHNTEYGSRNFSVRDPEGHLWTFGTYWPKVT